MTAETRTVRIRIEGRVQGVAFRDWMQGTAGELGVGGWVRNRRDGSVEAVLSGEPALVTDMLELCRRGPPAAMVRDVTVLGEEDGSYPGFHIRATA